MSHETISTDQNRPPRVAATDPEDQVLTAAAPADLWTPYGDSPQGKCWLEVAASGGDVVVCFRRDAVAAVTPTTGVNIPSGTSRRFYVDPTKDLFLDYAGAGVATWRRVGAICERSRQ
jgi:hypothetical protein